MFFSFSEDAHWNAEQQALEFGVEIGEYRGVVRVPRRVFQRLLPERPTPERCVEAYYLQRTRFESIAERKLRRRQLTLSRQLIKMRYGWLVLPLFGYFSAPLQRSRTWERLKVEWAPPDPLPDEASSELSLA